MSRLKRVLDSRGTAYLYLSLILLVMILLGIWQNGERESRENEYSQFYEEYAYSWYNTFDITLGVLYELFSVSPGLSGTDQQDLLCRRLAFWRERAPEPDLLETLIRVDHPGEEGFGCYRYDGGDFRPVEQEELKELVSSILKVHPGGSIIYEPYLFTLENGRPCLTFYSEEREIVTILVLNREVLVSRFIPRITEALFRDSILPGSVMVPAIVQYGKDEKVIYRQTESGGGKEAVILGPLTYLEFVPPEPEEPSEDWVSAFRDLEIENSFYLNYWLSSREKPVLPEELTGDFWKEIVPADRENWFFAYLPGKLSLKQQVFLEYLPSLILGYASLILLGLALMILYKYNRENRRLLVRQEEFVATMTHELRTPLHIITNGAGNLADGIISDKDGMVRYGELIRKEGLRLSGMIESILIYSGVSRREPDRQRISLDEVLEEVMPSFRLLCREQDIVLEERFQDNLHCCADREILKLILSNLLSNALKHGSGGKWIRVSTALWEELTITVEDRGQGIPRSELEKIREPFFRGVRTRESALPSNGLGLSIVDRIVRQEGGSLNIQSSEEAGSTFTVYLPIRPREGSRHE